MNRYRCYANNDDADVWAINPLEAQTAANKYFKIKRESLIIVFLVHENALLERVWPIKLRAVMNKISIIDVQHHAIQGLLIELTKGYNVMPKNKKLQSLIEEGLNSLSLYQWSVKNEN